jgi:hypothetical protein
VHPAAEQDDRFIEVLFGRVQVFFRQDDAVGVLAYLLIEVAGAGLGGDGDHVDEVEIGGVAKDFLLDVHFLVRARQVADHVEIAFIAVGQCEGEVDAVGADRFVYTQDLSVVAVVGFHLCLSHPFVGLAIEGIEGAVSFCIFLHVWKDTFKHWKSASCRKTRVRVLFIGKPST